MDWPTLLSDQRLGKDKNTQTGKVRSEWQRDYDRIIFSSAFRRLQDKTQVFPLSESDFTRTRLTHSLESASVGRSIGIEVGQYLVDQYDLDISAFDIGSIVSSACLAHDIGNPPFGHSGEEAIQDWFKNDGSKFITDLTDKEKLDFEMFEGNAQGFRVLASRKPQQNGGMQITYSTLGAFTKYPRESFNKEANKSISGISSKKHGFFQSDKEIFCDVASKLGLKPKSPDSIWFRHPLAFLVEAADDICYRIVDLEDGFLLKRVSFEQVKEKLLNICGSEVTSQELGEKNLNNIEMVEYLRAISLNYLIQKTAQCFNKNEKEILDGKFDKPLIEEIDESTVLKELEEFNREHIYKSKDVVSIEMSGFEVISQLLKLFVPAALDLIEKGDKASPKSKKVAEFVYGKKIDFDKYKGKNKYQTLLVVTDHVSGMTDSFAVATYKNITGMSLQNR